MRRIGIFLLFAALCSSVVHAQQTSIIGRVLDSSGATIASAAVTAERSDGGSSYSAITNRDGEYQLPTINASTYKLRAIAPGFGASVRNVSILVGQHLTIDFTLSPAAVASSVYVTTDAAAIDTVSSEVSGNIDPEQTKKLPLNGNNWMQLAAIAPGIRQNAIGNTPLNQNSWGTFQINVDGQQVTQTNEYSWKGEPQFSRDAIAEFQVATNRFDATHGRSSFLQINAQTKSGGNELHGSAFGYFRNSGAGSASTPVANQVLPFSDQLYGGTVGGPIRKDKLFYFLSYETDRNPTTTVTTPYGFSPYYKAGVVNTWKYLGRFDYKLNATNSFSLRTNAHVYNNPLYNVSSTANPANIDHWSDNSLDIQLDYNHIFSPNLISDLKVGSNHAYYGQEPYTQGIQLAFPSTTIGVGGIYDPCKQNQENLSLREDLYWIKKKHNLKIGSELIAVNEHGIYYFAQYGQAVLTANVGSGVLASYTWSQIFPNLLDPSTWNLAALDPAVQTYKQNFGDPHFGVPHKTFAAWVQDDWSLFKRLTLNLGVRYDNDFQAFNVRNRPSTSLGIYEPTHGDNNNIQPRVGLAWDPWGHGKTVVRAGVGLYYSDIMTTFVKKSSMLNGVNNVIPSITKTSTTTIDLTNPFNGATAADVRANPSAYNQAIFTLDPDLSTPWTVQASVGVQQDVNGVLISADYVHDRSHRLWVAKETNVYYDSTTGLNKNPSVYGRPNANFGSILTYASPDNVGSIYDALLVNVEKLRWRSLQGSAAYTLAWEKSNNVFNNPFNFGASWGSAVDDQQHTLNATLRYDYRWGLRSGLLFHYGSGVHYDVSAGTQPTGMTSSDPIGLTNRYYAAGTTTYNNPAHNHYDAKTGYYVTDKDQLTGASIQRLDLNIAKDTKLNKRLQLTTQVEIFNALNHANYGAYQTSILSSSFGKPVASTTSSYWPRSLQFAARLSF